MGDVVTDVVVFVTCGVVVIVVVCVVVVVAGAVDVKSIDVDRTFPFYQHHQILIFNVPESNTVFMHDCTLFAIL